MDSQNSKIFVAHNAQSNEKDDQATFIPKIGHYGENENQSKFFWTFKKVDK